MQDFFSLFIFLKRKNLATLMPGSCCVLSRGWETTPATLAPKPLIQIFNFQIILAKTILFKLFWWSWEIFWLIILTQQNSMLQNAATTWIMIEYSQFYNMKIWMLSWVDNIISSIWSGSKKLTPLFVNDSCIVECLCMCI